ncbi:lectin-like [Sardina pilchardus]|uniref:lectin-like n=1 Tax=Sardina pilchardus TaxID=27697 RepID=UPI002E133D86
MKIFRLMLMMTLGIPVLCAREIHKPTLNLTECPIKGYKIWYMVGPYCARHFHKPLEFGKAELRCRKQHADGHLISVHNNKTNNELTILTGSWHTEAWIGGYRLPCVNDFVWTDGSKWDYHNWVPGEPNGSADCIQINWHTSGKFDDAKCCGKRSFVCAFLIKQ